MEAMGGEDGESQQRHGGKRSRMGPPGGVTDAAVAGSRIYRVTRAAAGGKDRHSKVYTAKGIRDRRVRLSVPTAIQFYDLQDRLGYDQPSKAIEWLIQAASAAIDELPSLDPTALSTGPAADAGAALQQQLSKSGCSSTSETSKGSELSLSRSDGRVLARDREDKEAAAAASSSAQATSFTEILTGAALTGAEHRKPWQPPPLSATAAVGLAQPGKGGQAPRRPTQALPSPTAVRFGNVGPIGMAPAQPFNFATSAAMTQLSYVQDTFVPVNTAPASGPAGDYSLNFSMSSGFVGVHRGTLQSNSQPHFSGHHHHHHHQQLQRLPAPQDSPNIPFLFSQAVAAPQPSSESPFAAAAMLQLWDRHSGMKEKSKN